MTYDRWLRRRMKQLDLRIAPFARQVGKTRQQVMAWRRGSSLPPMTQVPAIALVLGTDEARLRARILASRALRKTA